MGREDEKADNPIRVLQVMDKFAMRGAPIHGAAIVLLTWWPAFENTEYPLTICVLRGHEGGIDEFHDIGADVIDLDRHKIDPLTILDLIKIIRRDNIRILHLHGYGATTFGRIAAKICRIPAIVHEHMIAEKTPRAQSVADFLLTRLTTKGVAVSKAVANFMVEKRFIERDKTEVLFNSIAPSIGQTVPHDDKRRLTEELGIPADRSIIGIVGRLDPIKGHTFFLDAANQVLEKKPQAHFVILGAGDLLNALLEKSKQLGIEHYVSFLGHRRNVEEIVSLFDVYVCCSLTEGLSIAMIEAMALRRPIVATRVGGIPELIEDGVSGILVPPKDPDSIANAILDILNGPELGHRLGENAVKQYKEKFELSGIAEQLKNIYHDIIVSDSN